MALSLETSVLSRSCFPTIQITTPRARASMRLAGAEAKTSAMCSPAAWASPVCLSPAARSPVPSCWGVEARTLCSFQDGVRAQGVSSLAKALALARQASFSRKATPTVRRSGSFSRVPTWEPEKQADYPLWELEAAWRNLELDCMFLSCLAAQAAVSCRTRRGRLSPPKPVGTKLRGIDETAATQPEAAPSHWATSFWLLLTSLILLAPGSLCLAAFLTLPSLLPAALAAWAVAELGFVALRLGAWNKVDNAIVQNELPDENTARQLLSDLVALRRTGVQPSTFLQQWFRGAPLEKINLSHVKDLISYILYHRTSSELPAEMQPVAEANLNLLVKAWSLKVQAAAAQTEAAMDQTLSFMRHTSEPLRASLHPLAWYAFGEAVGTLTVMAMRLMGFERRVCKRTGMGYFLKEKKGAEGAKEDITLFVHGLGVGLTPYLAFVYQLALAAPSPYVAVIELPHLAARLVSAVPTVEALAEGIDEVLEECVGSTGKVTVVGHSYGSFVSAHYVRTRSERIASLGLMDPPCLLLCLPDVVYSFFYKSVASMLWAFKFEEVACRLLVAREMNTARALSRGFNWQALHMWAHQMPSNTVVLLSGQDHIVPSKQVDSYLRASGVPTIYLDNLRHGQVLAEPHQQQVFLASLFPKQSVVAV